MKYRRFLVPLLLALIALSACGQKGPLYLPDTVTHTETNKKAD